MATLKLPRAGGAFPQSQARPPTADTARAHKLNVHFANVDMSGRKTFVWKALDKILRTEERTISEEGQEKTFTVPFSRLDLKLSKVSPGS
jgi:hypothetical protein